MSLFNSSLQLLGHLSVLLSPLYRHPPLKPLFLSLSLPAAVSQSPVGPSTPYPAVISDSRGGAEACRTSWRTKALPEWPALAPAGGLESPRPPPRSPRLIPRWWSPSDPSWAPRFRSPSSQGAPTWGSRTPPSCAGCWTSSTYWPCRSKCKLERGKMKKHYYSFLKLVKNTYH